MHCNILAESKNVTDKKIIQACGILLWYVFFFFLSSVQQKIFLDFFAFSQIIFLNKKVEVVHHVSVIMKLFSRSLLTAIGKELAA